MNTMRNILVPFDDNLRSIRALEYAAMFASGIGAKITALHIADPKDYHSKEDFDRELADMVENQLQPKLQEIHKHYSDIRKIDLQIRGMDKSIPDHILEFSLEHQIDFIVMRSHGLTQADDWELHFKSTNAYKVLLDTPCPVFTFTQIPNQPRMENIVVPIDLSEGSLFKVPFAIDLGRRFHARLHLVAASEQSEDQHQLAAHLEEVQAKCATQEVETVANEIHKGTLPDMVFRYCEHHPIDLVIIMSRPGFRWSDLWVSPKAKRIVSWSKVPVLSLRTDKPLSVGL